MEEQIIIAQASGDLKEIGLATAMTTRHGLIAGATGTGKTVTLQTLAEQFSLRGVPVFLADVKGDLAGLATAGGGHPKIEERGRLLGMADYAPKGFPVVFWDVFGEQGHPARTTISEMGPLLMSRLLDLNEVQSGVLTLAYRVADDEGLLLLDLKDLRSMLRHVGDHASEYRLEYGNVSEASVGAIQRKLLAIEEQGAEELLGEPGLNLHDLLQSEADGRGKINILASDQLFRSPQVYATFLLWLLAELFEQLPEAGDLPQPKLVFFFDEAHLLFEDAPKALVDKIELVVRLIRSKGVAVFFVTQNPLDLPPKILSQLGTRVSHSLRAFTAAAQRVVRAVAETFRPNETLDVEAALKELSVGEAIVSFLDRKGVPGKAERAFIRPPMSLIGGLSRQERLQIVESSALYGQYERVVDRESAHELLLERTEQERRSREEAEESKRRLKEKPVRSRESLYEAMAKSAVRSVGSALGRRIVRGVLGSLLK